MSVKNTKNNFVKRTGLLGNFISGKYEGHSVNQVSSDLGYGELSATGGETVTDSGYTYHVFVNPGTFSITGGESPIECLVVAGGAGGGQDGYHSGGGGAGGILYASSFLVSEGNSFPISVGGGGAPIPNISTQSPPIVYPRGNDGSPSHIGIITAIGGGGGGNYYAAPVGPGASGGSGGGAAWPVYVGGLTLQTPVGSFVGYGNSGGSGGSGGGIYATGGGGGAGAAGGTGTPSASGNGGAGQPFPNFPAPVLAPALTAAGVPAPQVSAWTSAVGPTGVFGGGGGGSTYDPSPTLFATGGPGGGGDGGNITIASKPGINYTGGGGGTSTHNPSAPSGGGGNGIVLIRYQTS